MDTNIITWIFLGVFGLFIFFKFKKFLPYKQDARSVNYYHTEQHPVRERITREVRTVKKEPARRETVDDYDDDYKEPDNSDDIWSKTLREDADIANEMFGVDRDEN